MCTHHKVPVFSDLLTQTKKGPSLIGCLVCVVPFTHVLGVVDLSNLLMRADMTYCQVLNLETLSETSIVSRRTIEGFAFSCRRCVCFYREKDGFLHG